MPTKSRRRNARRRTAGQAVEPAGRTGRYVERAEGEELAGEVLAYVRRYGITVSEADLSGLRRAGIIPSPRRIHLGRGLGTASVYPSGSAELVLMAMRLVGRPVTPALARELLAAQGYLPLTFIRNGVTTQANDPA